MKRFLAIFCLMSAILVTTLLSARAQSDSYAITWFTFGESIGTSSNDDYVLKGATGQPEAGVNAMSGGEFVLNGGFWSNEIHQQQVYLPLITR